MTSREFDDLLRSLADGWTNRQYSSVAASFAEDVFYSDALNYSLRGRASLLNFFEDDDGASQHCEFRLSLFDEERQIGVAEYSYKGSFRYHGTVWIKLSNDKIVNWREYQHRSDKDWKEFWNQ